MGELWVGTGTQGVDGLSLIRMIFQTDRCGNCCRRRTVPTAQGEASDTTRVGEDRLKCASTGELLIAFFNSLKAV